MTDTLVFDIETQNFFTDPEVGWGNYQALKISVVGVYSYVRNEFLTFEEHELGKLAELFRGSDRIVGFSMNRYDVPVLQNYFLREKHGVDLWGKQRVDLLEEVELATGQRISLDKLARANLPGGKTGHGSEAIGLFKEGKMEELKKYCLKDVEITKDLYDLYRLRRFLYVPHRVTGETSRVSFIV
ncbi:MAG: ribonuclease H-like domain-containing protein [Anaplasmataceae bacterium]|nr:ribonuclease H-like domain-containing protein [Anaplasmataceae bacterium]